MARKLNKPAADQNVQVSAQNHEQKDLLDPVTTAAVGAFGWFAFKAALQGVIGWVAVQLFIPVWNWWKGSKEENESHPDLSTKEQEPES